MDKAAFLNRVRSLFNIDDYLLPELSEEEQAQFVRNPPRYLMHADKGQSDAIWREVEKRQTRWVRDGPQDRHQPRLPADSHPLLRLVGCVRRLRWRAGFGPSMPRHGRDRGRSDRRSAGARCRCEVV